MSSYSAWPAPRALRVVASLIAIAPLSGCTDSGTTDMPQEPVEEGTYFMRDSDDRVVILHGLNIMSSSKGDPERLPVLTEQDVERYAQLWGFNAVRYLIFWDAIEPSRGEYDAEYLDFSLTPPDGDAANFDRTVFTEFYQRMINAIREVDDEGWILYEPRYAAPANGQPSFILDLTDPREGEPRIVYGPHLYSIAIELRGSYDPAAVDRRVGFRPRLGQRRPLHA